MRSAIALFVLLGSACVPTSASAPSSPAPDVQVEPAPVPNANERAPILGLVFMGWLRRFTDSGFAHDRGLLDLIAVTQWPLTPDARWIYPPNGPHHPKARALLGLDPLDAQLARVPAELNPDAPDVWFGLGIAYAEIPERQRAIEALRRFLDIAENGDVQVPPHVIHAARDAMMRMESPI